MTPPLCSASLSQTVVSKYGSQFRGNSQHDALEFLLWLLDRVHEDVNLASHNNNNRIKAPTAKVRSTNMVAGHIVMRKICSPTRERSHLPPLW